MHNTIFKMNKIDVDENVCHFQNIILPVLLLNKKWFQTHILYPNCPPTLNCITLQRKELKMCCFLFEKINSPLLA